MRRTKEEAEKTREKLLQAAESVFGQKGYAATRLSDIAEEARVTRGAIYHHFANKKELFICLNKERVNPYLKLLDHIFTLDLSPKEKMVRLLKEIIQHAFSDMLFQRKQRFEFLRGFELVDVVEFKEYIQEKESLYKASMLVLVKQAQKTGEIRRDVIAEHLLFNIGAYMKGLLAMIITDSDREYIREHGDALVETLFKGLEA